MFKLKFIATLRLFFLFTASSLDALDSIWFENLSIYGVELHQEDLRSKEICRLDRIYEESEDNLNG